MSFLAGPLPFAQAFFVSVDALNAWVTDRRVRRYQRQILAENTLCLISPFTGECITASGSYWIMPAGYVAYRFDFGRTAWIVAGELRFGFPLTTLLIEGGAPIGVFDAGSAGVRNKGASPLSFLALETAWAHAVTARKAEGAGKPALLIGTPNFAHYLWNELPGLLDLVAANAAAPDYDVDIISLFEPLGPLEAIVDDKIMRSCDRVSADDPAINARTGLSTRIGSTLVSRQAQTAVLSYIEKRRPLDDLTQRFLVTHREVFWVSVRGDNRTCVNQIEYLSTVVGRLMSEFPQCGLCFDGFSYPEDVEFDSRYATIIPGFNKRASDCARMIAQIMDIVASRSRPDARKDMLSVSGRALDYAISAAKSVDYYICHAGTIQHKVAWLYKKPGYIHSCTDNITKGAINWYVNQVEDADKLDCIPANLVEDIPSGDSRPKRNWSYRIVDVDAAAQDVVRCVREALARKTVAIFS